MRVCMGVFRGPGTSPLKNESVPIVKYAQNQWNPQIPTNQPHIFYDYASACVCLHVCYGLALIIAPNGPSVPTQWIRHHAGAPSWSGCVSKYSVVENGARSKVKLQRTGVPYGFCVWHIYM